MKFSTKAIKLTHLPDETAGSISTPIYLSTTFERAADGSHPYGHVYSRSSNPNRDLLESAMTVLEQGEDCIAFASGMAAINAVLQQLKPGDHVIIPEDAYYTLILLVNDVFGQWGLTFSKVDMTSTQNVSDAITENTRLIWIESPSNPQLRLADISAIATIAHNNNALCVVDNTWSTPVLQNPLVLGADIVMHASTKYIGGHSDVLSGLLVFKESNELADKIRHYQKVAGAVPSPFDCWLLTRGLKTLALRVNAQTESTIKIAHFLSKHPAVEQIFYPGLSTHPQHDLAKSQMKNFGAMLSFNLKGTEQNALAFTGKLNIFTAATSLGGVESLIEHRKSIEGVTSISPPNLLRLSIGLEDADDLIQDLKEAFEQ